VKNYSKSLIYSRKVYNSVNNKYYYSSLYAESLYFCEEYELAIKIFKEIQSKMYPSEDQNFSIKEINTIILDSYYYLALCYLGINNYDLAKENFIKYLKLRKKGMRSEFYALDAKNNIQGIQNEDPYFLIPEITYEIRAKKIEKIVEEFYENDKNQEILDVLIPEYYKFPEEYYWAYWISQAFWDMHKYDLALEYITKAYQTAPEDSLIINSYGILLILNERYPEGIHQLLRIHKFSFNNLANGKHGEGKKAAYGLICESSFWLSWAYYKTNKIKNSYKYYIIYKDMVKTKRIVVNSISEERKELNKFFKEKHIVTKNSVSSSE
jgi:tetratricopeptide (TPR) repeat protein